MRRVAHSIRFRSIVAATLCALAAFAVPGRAQSEGDERGPEVKNVKLDGVKSVDKEDLRKSIATDESGCRSWLVKPICLFTKSSSVYKRYNLDREELKRDVVRIRVFYYQRGWREAKVDTAVVAKKGGVEVRFRVTEGPPTLVTRTAVDYPGDVLDERQVKKHVLLRRNRPLDLLKLDSSLVRLRAALWDKGYADANVVAESIAVSPGTRTAAVRIRIDPRPRTTVGSVRITGNQDVSQRTIRSSLFFTEGDLFRRDLLVRSQRQLYLTNMFRRAQIAVEPSEDSVKQVEVRVQEAPLHEVETRVGFNTIEFVQSDARYSEYNWFGRGRQLTLSGAVGNIGAQQLNGVFPFRDVLRGFDGDLDEFLRPTWHASAEVNQPAFFFSPKNSGGVGVFAHRRSAPGIYIDRGYGASASFTRDMAVRAPLSATYRFEITRVEAGDVYFCVNFGVCENEAIDALRARQRLSPVGLNFTLDRSSDPLSPRHGYIARLDAEHASAFTASDFRYNRAAAEGAVYRPIGRRGALAARLKLGWVRSLASTEQALDVAGAEDVLHPRKRFYAGGARSVRGYGENQLGPRVLTISDQRLRGQTDTAQPDGSIVTTYEHCDIAIPIEQCDPNANGLLDRYFLPRPVGGNSLLEASVELRVPLFWKLTGAVFVDGGMVGEGALGALGKLAGATGAVTPGFGVRYRSPVGPIRVDIGINPRIREELTVITEDRSAGTRRITQLVTPRLKYPRDDPSSAFQKVLAHLTLHLSIGEAY